MGDEERSWFESSDVVSMFPTLVWKLRAETAVRGDLDGRLRAWLEDARREAPPLGAGESWQSEPDLQRLEELRPFVDRVERAARGVLRFLHVDHEQLIVTGLWINASAPGAAHRLHHHPNNFLSGVYYLDVPPGADTISFFDPRPQVRVLRPPVTALSAENTDRVVVRVREGDLLLFPAWLEHAVDPNRAERERVSASFNLMFQDYVANMSPPGWSGGRRDLRGDPAS